MFSRKSDELPEWSVKKQKYYRFSRILWKAQIIIALIASAVILGFMLRL